MQQRFNSINEILDFAIEQEKKANKFYTELSERVKDHIMREVFEGFAREELQHKAKLEAIKRGEITVKPESVTSPGIAEQLAEPEPDSDMSYQEALILAMKKEKAAYRLYLEMAVATEDETLADTFFSMAQEEANHKLRFEVEYDDLKSRELTKHSSSTFCQ